MVWTYYSSQINTASTNANLMRVRFLVQDVSTADHLVQNQEIQWALADFPNIFEAASVVARAIGGKMAQRASAKTVTDATVSWAQSRANQYFELADSLKEIAASPSNRAIEVFAGGISKSDKDAQALDTDWAKPAFAVGLHRNPFFGEANEWILAST